MDFLSGTDDTVDDMTAGTTLRGRKMEGDCPATAAGRTDALTANLTIADNIRRIGMEAVREPVWEKLACHERPLHNAKEVFPNRETWREPPAHALCCSATTPCFRTVMDGMAMPPRQFAVNQRVRVRDYVAKRPPNAQGWMIGRVTKVSPLRVRAAGTSSARAYDEVRPAEELDDSYDARVVERVRSLLTSAAGLADSDMVVSSWRRQAIGAVDDFTRRFAFHFDYGQQGAAFSATLYESHHGEHPLIGGETAFVDVDPIMGYDSQRSGEVIGEEMVQPSTSMTSSVGLQRHANGSATLVRGLVVAPRIGRLVFFSGGAENYHAPLPVVSVDGDRACRSSSAAAAPGPV